VSGLAALRRRALRLVHGDDYRRADGACRLAPEWLVLVVNNACNLRCRMCDVGLDNDESVFYRHLVGEQPRNMPPALLERLLEQAAHFQPRPRIGLAYTEPLLHPEIRALCRSVAGHGFSCSITTNGFLLPRLAFDLVEAGVDEVTVSVDGPEDVHDRVRGVPGSFARIVEGLARLKQARERRGGRRLRLLVSHTLTDFSGGRLLDFARAVETQLQPDAVSVSHLNFISDDMAALHNAAYGERFPVTVSNVGSMDLPGLDLEALWQGLLDLKAYAASAAGFPPLTIVPELGSPERLALFYREPTQFVGGHACTDPWRMLLVRTDGSVIPAHGRCYDVPLGNIQETPVAEIWDGAAYRGFRQALKAAGGALPACARCCGVIGKPAAPAV
jgi:MoaA/NifB/PqqE/SkfB family radical SAM enzyme